MMLEKNSKIIPANVQTFDNERERERVRGSVVKFNLFSLVQLQLILLVQYIGETVQSSRDARVFSTHRSPVYIGKLDDFSVPTGGFTIVFQTIISQRDSFWLMHDQL